jgi:hypothetical protein
MSASIPSEASGPLGLEVAALSQAKKALLFTAGSALQRFGDSIRDEQEVLMHISNIVMEVFAMDTAICRLDKKQSAETQRDIARVFINDAISRIDFSARQALAASAEGDNLRTQLSALRRLLRWTPVNTVKARQRIADYLTDSNRYAL